MLRRVWESIIRHQRGVAAIEFALILPLFVLLLLGGYEAWQYIVADQRADRVSASVADLASRVDGSISEPVVNDLLDGGAFIGKPIDFTTNGVIYLSAVNGGDANLLPADRNKILWCRVLGNTTLAASSLGSVGSKANLASVTTSAGVVGDDTTLLVAEVMVHYKGTFLPGMLADQVIKRTAIYPARTSAAFVLSGGPGSHPCP